jgi:hypothetical protein
MNPFVPTQNFTQKQPDMPPVVIPIGRGYFCLNCELIHTSHHCPKCDKGESIPLLKWLGIKG